MENNKTQNMEMSDAKNRKCWTQKMENEKLENVERKTWSMLSRKTWKMLNAKNGKG